MLRELFIHNRFLMVKLLNRCFTYKILPFVWHGWMKTPHVVVEKWEVPGNMAEHKALSVKLLLAKSSMTHLIHLILINVTCFYSSDWKVLKQKHFVDMEEMKKKMMEVLKCIIFKSFRITQKKLKRHLYLCLATNKQYLKEIWFLRSTKIFITKFQFFWEFPPS